jgi:hippurate hydrolase
VVGANILLALQSIVARNLDPLKAGVVTVDAFRGGTVANVIPQSAELLRGTSAAAATPGEKDRTRLLGYRTVPSPSPCFNGAITSPSAA